MNIKDLENIKKQITTTYKNNLKYNSLKRLCNKYNKLIVKLEDNEIEIIKELEKINFESVNKKELIKLGLTQLVLKAKNKLLNIFIKEEINKLISSNNNPKDKEIIDEEYYDVFDPERYKRTYQFWESATTKMLNNTCGQVFMNPSAMHYKAGWNPKSSNTEKGASVDKQFMFILPVCLIVWCE